MTSSQIRDSFLQFFRDKQHTIVPSSSLMPDSPNLLFTNAGMNQFVPIFLGQQKCSFQPPRVADTQKCIRAGGKHNDLEDVGMDTYHHTFFEMLGNWSFGDYFKADAIEWAWELITNVWRFPKNRLYATVYSPGEGDPAEFDQEAYDRWAELFSRAGLDPKVHIVRGNKQDNFWMMGDTGPCGPCSEIHVDLTAGGDTKGALVNRGTAECIEIWNLVFIQLNANADGTFTPLPAKHVDTGMGFERVAAIIQGTKNFTDFNHPVSNYDTDIFRPLFDKLSHLSGRRYECTLPSVGSPVSDPQSQIAIDIAFRVIGDHIRTLSFAIADGILPGNTDRNYVLRRILRRAVRYGRTLGFHEPFFYKLVEVVSETMGDVFPEIRQRQQHIADVIRTEEEAFNRTLDRGIELFNAEAERISEQTRASLSGAFAFKLYDTYGFPLDLTELMARERGLAVDIAEFDRLMEEQRARARSAQKREVIELSQVENEFPTVFRGYDLLDTEACVIDVIKIKNRTAVITDNSVCYAEMGGQVGDTGTFELDGKLWIVADTRKAGQTWLHFLEGENAPEMGAKIKLHVDTQRRAAIQRHHTVTHLFHWALHEVVSREASQKGSFVGPEKLTFDFNSAPLSPDQIHTIERLVNERILENAFVSWVEVPYESVRNRKDVLQFFGEKYGDLVRVVQIGGDRHALNGYSMELCGGTHTSTTGEIGLFRITAESAIAAGVRRIEAVAGLRAYEAAIQDYARLHQLAATLNAPIGELEKKLEAVLAQNKALEKQIASFAQQRAADTAKSLRNHIETFPKAKAIIQNIGDGSGDQLQRIAEQLHPQFDGVVVLMSTDQGRVHLLASVPKSLTATYQAGKIIQALAPKVNGKGGGKPELARGAGSDPSGIPVALAEAKAFLLKE